MSLLGVEEVLTEVACNLSNPILAPTFEFQGAVLDGNLNGYDVLEIVINELQNSERD